MGILHTFFKVLLLFLASVLMLVFLLFIGEIIFNKTYKFPQKIKLGVTYSPQYAGYLHLDWRQTYMKILDELNVKNLRLPTYWHDLESEAGKYNFEDVDFMLSEAQKKQARVILILGARQPRWPECHFPAWAKKLSINDRQQKNLNFISKVVERYKDHPEIFAWQVENEPLFPFFGECDALDSNFLKSEVSLVKKLDKRKVMVTDSGEFGFWVIPMQISDIFGTTVYRRSYDPIIGYKTYPVLPYFYNIKSYLIRKIFAPHNQKTIISELQTEIWLSQKDQSEATPDRQAQRFSVKFFKENIEYAKETGFDEAYLWGVEWWYFMNENGHPEYLEYAKTLFR